MKKIIKFILCICAMFIAVYLIYDYYKDQEPVGGAGFISKDDDFEKIKNLQKEYNNTEIVMYIELPGVFSMPIVQTENNEYYSLHNVYKEESDVGTPYLDYRTKSLEDKKIIVYGYNKMDISLPFSNLSNYQSEDFLKNHPDIIIYTENGEKTYSIFSVFTENKDFSYRDINGFIGNEYYEHLLGLKDKSIYDTNVKLSENSKVIVFESCALSSGCEDNSLYQVLIAKEVKPLKEAKNN